MYLVDVDIKKYTDLEYSGYIEDKITKCKKYLQATCGIYDGKQEGKFQGDGGLFMFLSADSAAVFVRQYFNFVDHLNENNTEKFFINAAIKKIDETVKFPIEDNVKNPKIDSFGHISKTVFNYKIDRHIFWVCEYTYNELPTPIKLLFSPVPHVIDEKNRNLRTAIFRYNPPVNNIFLKPNLKVLVLGAHCDDIELGCSGTISFLRDHFNADIYYRVLSCCHVSSSGSKREDFEGRGAHAVRSANLLLNGKEITEDDAKKISLNFRDSNNIQTKIRENAAYLRDNKILVTNYYEDMNFDRSPHIIRDELGEIENIISPDLVLGPSLVDIHQDHTALAMSINQKFRRKVFWQYLSPDTGAIIGNFSPNIFIKISDAIMETGIYSAVEGLNDYFDLKLKALKYFKTEFERDWFYEENFRSITILGARSSRYPKHNMTNDMNLTKTEFFMGALRS